MFRNKLILNQFFLRIKLERNDYYLNEIEITLNNYIVLWITIEKVIRYLLMKEDNDRKKENSKFHFLFIYWDPDDKRIFVPKRWGLGWTINFANPLSIITLFVIILIISLLARFF